ncbi:MAG: LysM peptidoglycan-binding domain-containing protein [Bacillota bacterium]|jgi:LysM repeat protein
MSRKGIKSGGCRFISVGLSLIVTTFGSFCIPEKPVIASPLTTAEVGYLYYSVKAGDTLYILSTKYGTTIKTLIELNGLVSTEIRIGQVLKIPDPASNKGTTYQVQPGDTLYLISLKYGTNVADLMSVNSLTSSELRVGQLLKIPVTCNRYLVQPGDTLYLLAQRFGTTVDKLKTLNHLTSDLIYVGQLLTLPSEDWVNHTVRSGDTLYLISQRYHTTIAQLMTKNNLKSTMLQVGQVLSVPISANSPGNPAGPPTPPPHSPSSVNWIIPDGAVLVQVKPGQDLWGLSQQYNTTIDAIKTTNHLHVDWVGIKQPLFIPVNSSKAVSVVAPQVPAKAGYGEWLDWEFVYWIFDIGNQAVIRDLETGKRFTVQRIGGSNHADCEPLTKQDTQIMKEIFGGYWGWRYRPVLVEVDGRVLAASMAGMPHDIDTISGNNFAGHFDLHFLNSRQHNTNQINSTHQANVQKAAGY